ncbi:hypothetical protein [Zooshikella ganghwensis]|uniref:hypothetical protein n=1 Tax=Zooshikella ganghwensis TaxID=202772 RepID=UPI00041A4EA3|nr:hypothetical protein [Zooshikella ganghwensis]
MPGNVDPNSLASVGAKYYNRFLGKVEKRVSLDSNTGRLARAHFEDLTSNFADNVTSSNFASWKRSLQQSGISDRNIQDVIHHGSLKKGENIFGDDWAKYYSEISGTEIPRDAMIRPHAHHKAEKKGGLAAGALNRQILQEVNINPELSRHNLTWAPNVKGQHGFSPQSELLKMLLEVRGDRNGVIKVLRQWDEISKSR